MRYVKDQECSDQEENDYDPLLLSNVFTTTFYLS